MASSLDSDFMIISGGQTGVDRGALDAALEVGLAVGGWCPEGRKAEDGAIDPKYPLKVLPGADYRQRTLKNVQDSEATVIVYFHSLKGGTKKTYAYCRNEKKPCLLVDACKISSQSAAEIALKFIRDRRIKVLNVAGPRESKEPQAYEYTRQLFRLVFREC